MYPYRIKYIEILVHTAPHYSPTINLFDVSIKTQETDLYTFFKLQNSLLLLHSSIIW